jgi:hypothetical protein
VCHMITTSAKALLHEISKCRLLCGESHWSFHKTGKLKMCPAASAALSNQQKEVR